MNSRRFWRPAAMGAWAAVLLSISALALATAWMAGSHKGKALKEEWMVLEPLHYQNLHIFPIVPAPGASRSTPGYITLDEGLKAGSVEVTEVGSGPTTPIIRNRPPGNQNSANVQSEQNQTAQAQSRQQSSGAEVNRLWITNRSGKKLLLLAGELVVGGKQDRIVQKDMIVPSGKQPFDLSVFCVEHGRWQGQTAQFGSADNALVKASGGIGGGGGVADPTVRGTAQAERSQGAVWQKVGEKNAQAGVNPASGTYRATIQSDKGQKDAKPYMDAIQPKMPKSAVGAVVAIHGQIVWVDAFASNELFQKYWPKLLQSYIVDAMTTPVPRVVANERIPRVLRNAPSSKDAAQFLFDWTGKSTFEGLDDIYMLTRIEASNHVIFRLRDITKDPDPLVHFCKMKKR